MQLSFLKTGIPAEVPQSDQDDELLPKAIKIILTHQRVSVSLIQRHLLIGYNRAARLLETMEKAGIVSVMKRDGTREILVKELPNQESKS